MALMRTTPDQDNSAQRISTVIQQETVPCSLAADNCAWNLTPAFYPNFGFHAGLAALTFNIPPCQIQLQGTAVFPCSYGVAPSRPSPPFLHLCHPA